MKNAILLSGFLRHFFVTSDTINKISDLYNADIFVVCPISNHLKMNYKLGWTGSFINRESLTKEYIKSIYKNVKDILFVNHIPFFDSMLQQEIDETKNAVMNNINNVTVYKKEMYDFLNETESYDYIKSCLNQYLQFYTCFELMDSYSKRNNIKYENVVRIRPDTFFIGNIENIFDQLFSSNTKLNTIRRPEPNIYIDFVFGGNYDNMKKMSNLYKHIFKKFDINDKYNHTIEGHISNYMRENMEVNVLKDIEFNDKCFYHNIINDKDKGPYYKDIFDKYTQKYDIPLDKLLVFYIEG